MATRPEALKYLEHQLRNDKQFAIKALAEVIYKTCDPDKLEAAIKKWKALNPDKASKQVPSQPSINGQSDWDNFG